MRVRPPNPPCHSPSIGRAARNSPQNIKNKSANFYVENEPLLPLGSTVAGSSRSEPSRLRSLTIHSPPSRCRKAHARALQTPRCVWRLLCLLSRCSQTLAATAERSTWVSRIWRPRLPGRRNRKRPGRTVSPIRSHDNDNATPTRPTSFGALSPKTRQATAGVTRQNAPPRATDPVALSCRLQRSSVTPNACPDSPYGCCRQKRARRRKTTRRRSAAKRIPRWRPSTGVLVVGETAATTVR
jgi:hypothetical protein